MNNNKMIYLLAFASGFLSLSLEVVWMRIMSFAAHSVPQAFSYTLALFLVGIAVGAHFGRKICRNRDVDVPLIGRLFFAAAVTDILLFATAYAAIFGKAFFWTASLCILISASVRGIVFPLVHHLGTEKVKSGKQISNVYFSNVAGSSLAPVLIGFVVLDFFSTQQVYLSVCVLSLLLAALCAPKTAKKLCAGAATAALALTVAAAMLPETLFHALSKDNVAPNHYPDTLIENKHGFIQVYNHQGDSVVWGANVYDGKFNTSLFHDSNGIERAYVLPLLKPDAENVLVIGLSTGSWVRVLSTMPNLKKMTVVEINPDYVELVKNHPEVAPLLQDKRIEIVTDDGRRWLRRHDEQFDLVLMNTTWHWRAYISNLLSQDFLTMIRSHLKPGGVVSYNTTNAYDAFATAASVFPYVYRYSNMVIAADHALAYPDPAASGQRLAALTYPESGKPVLENADQIQAALQQITLHKLMSYQEYGEKYFSKVLADRPLEIITDNNMITEYKYGIGLKP